MITSGRNFREKLGEIFNWMNTRNKLMGDPNTFDILKPADVRRFFSIYLPSQMGNYLARLHETGLSHAFASGHNWSVAGTLYDLDSIFGKLLGDPEIRDEDIVRDIKSSGIDYRDTIFDLRFNQVIDREDVWTLHRYFAGYLHQTFNDWHSMREEFIDYFVVAYIGQRNKPISSAQIAEVIEKYKQLMQIDIGYGYPGNWTENNWQRISTLLHENLSLK